MCLWHILTHFDVRRLCSTLFVSIPVVAWTLSWREKNNHFVLWQWVLKTTIYNAEKIRHYQVRTPEFLGMSEGSLRRRKKNARPKGVPCTDSLSVSTLDAKTYEPSCTILIPMRNYKPAKLKIFMTKSMHQNIGALPARVNDNSLTEGAVSHPRSISFLILMIQNMLRLRFSPTFSPS